MHVYRNTEVSISWGAAFYLFCKFSPSANPRPACAVTNDLEGGKATGGRIRISPCGHPELELAILEIPAETVFLFPVHFLPPSATRTTERPLLKDSDFSWEVAHYMLTT